MIPGDRNINPLDRIAEFICSHLDSRQLYTCLGCGTCSNLCPASGMQGVDPCALVQMVLDGKEEAVLNTPWVWHCSGCSLCLASCPEGVDVPRLVSLIRSVQDDCMLPEGLRSRLSTWISTGNLSGMYPLEYLALLDSASGVYAQRSGHKTFKLPVDKKGARVLLIVDPGLLKLRPDILPAYIHLFQAAREDWTLSSMPFGSVDMAMVSGISRHRGIWQTTFEAIVERLCPEIVVLDDCPNEMAPFGPFGNKGLEQEGVKVVGILSLVKKYLSSGQLNLGKRFGRSLTLQEPCSNTDQDLVAYCR
ncbi:MAG: (Fe-S)-binding protein, partial [Thermodesulfobacteria bacterium]|nr:(Fe-S)-binding protein [Thermodesulfobacteriota bacterium]